MQKENKKKVKGMVAEKVTLSEISHKVALALSEKLERLEERIINLELLATSENDNEIEEIKLVTEAGLDAFRESVSQKVVKEEVK